MAELCLVINHGSSSLKAALYAPEGHRRHRRCWKDGCSLEAGSSQPKHALEAKLHQWLAPALEPHRSAIHQTLTAATRTYALPQELRDQGFRRFGFHSLNHQHISQVVGHQWTRQGHDPRQLRLISAHLGAGPERWHR